MKARPWSPERITRRLSVPGSPVHRAARDRFSVFLRVVAPDRADASMADQVAAVCEILSAADPPTVWLALAVLGAELPTPHQTLSAVRSCRLDGGAPTVAHAALPELRRGAHARRWMRRVRVLEGGVVVDLHHTSQTHLATGIQRVARRTAGLWDATHEVTLVGWTPDQRAMRELDVDERTTALHGAPLAPRRRGGGYRDVVVPWRSTYLLPELAVEHSRTIRIQAVAEFSLSRTGVIGFDCVPVTSAETIGGGMGAGFAGYLAALRTFDHIAAISGAAAGEFAGWRTMLASVGLRGPEITAIPLPVEADRPSVSAADDLQRELSLHDAPIVLCVGSHEPRKNHLAVLHAAELCWRRGTSFQLVFVGGNAWNSASFEEQESALQAAGRPVHSVTGLSDDLLWAAYRNARVVVFPSLNEGFGLPVAEALAIGTPVITSAFGSMAEIAAAGGAVLVDPRDDHALAEAIERVVTDEQEHRRLADEAARIDRRTWDEYACRTWDCLVDGGSPSDPQQ